MKKIKLIITIELDEETGKYVAICKLGWGKSSWPGVASCGDNIPEAVERIADAFAGYWRTLEDLGELEDVLGASRA